MDTTEITYIIVLGRTASVTIVRPKSVEQGGVLQELRVATHTSLNLSEVWTIATNCRTRLQRYTFSIKYTIAYDMLYHKKQTTNQSNALITNTWHYRQLSPLRTFCSAASLSVLAPRPVYIHLIWRSGNQEFQPLSSLQSLQKNSHLPPHQFAYVNYFYYLCSHNSADNHDTYTIHIR